MPTNKISPAPIAHLTIKRRHRNRREAFISQIRNYLKCYYGIKNAEIRIATEPPVKKENILLFKLNSSLEPVLQRMS